MKWFSRLTKIRANKKEYRGNRALGQKGEEIAARFLARRGYRILERNARTLLGEIDIVARKGAFIVFVEVKTRKSLRFGPPYLSVTHQKKLRLIRSARAYLSTERFGKTGWRIDVISIELDPGNESLNKIEHFEDALEEY